MTDTDPRLRARGEAIAARARGDRDAERRALDELALLDRAPDDFLDYCPERTRSTAPRYSPVDGATVPACTPCAVCGRDQARGWCRHPVDEAAVEARVRAQIAAEFETWGHPDDTLTLALAARIARGDA